MTKKPRIRDAIATRTAPPKVDRAQEPDMFAGPPGKAGRRRRQRRKSQQPLQPLHVAAALPDGVVLVLGRVDDLVVAQIVDTTKGGHLFRFEVPTGRTMAPLVNAAFWHEVAKRVAEAQSAIAVHSQGNG